MSSMPALKPRLVHLVKQPGVASFGFNVTATRSEPHRYVGIVVDNSLARQAGLRSGDRVHEVNGVRVDGLPLPKVQGMVAQGGTQVQLLVADPMTDQLYRDNNESIRGGLPETIYVKIGGADDVHLHGLTNGDVEIEAEVVGADDFMNSDDRHGTANHIEEVLIQESVRSYKARLCTVRKWPDYQGYGFVLHGDKEVAGQNIGKIEHGSPAETAGLREGDKLVEVNGVNVEGEYQQHVVRRIASGPIPNETTLLVVDQEAYNFFSANGMSVHSSMVDVDRLETPPRAVVAEKKPVIIQNGDAGSKFKARLCTVKKWPDYQGFGFVMHGDKDEPGQNVGKVDANSPAEAAGVRQGDRVIEVNGINVENEFQQQVVGRIATGPVPNETTMLVVDPDTLRFFRGHGVAVHSSMAEMERIETPARHLVPARPSTVQVRLCHVRKWHDFPGFGFILHGEKGVPGTSVTNIDHGSPAEAAGLNNGDIIVEVNGVNVRSDEQPQAIGRIQRGVDGDTSETRLLVVDSETDLYYKRQNIAVSGSMADVVYLTNPDRDVPQPVHLLPDPIPEPVYVPETASESPPSKRSSAGIRARLCHLKKWSTYDGYGFYLTQNEDSPGVRIGKIDANSPAEAAGLRVNDKIIEVNGVNAESDDQNEIVEKVILVPHETRLLVVDKLAYNYFLKMGVLVNGNMTDVDIIEAPEK